MQPEEVHQAMRILFLARHDGHDNDDEGAVAHALSELGHDVTLVHEKRGKRQQPIHSITADFCLFFKHQTVSEIQELSKRMPCAFWYFDMVESVEGDPTLKARSMHRLQWMSDVLPLVVAGFCTDGDWVAKVGGPLVHLTQGADARVAGLGKAKEGVPPIIFTGMVNHGQKRVEHVRRLGQRYGDKFGVLGDSGPRHRVHGRALADVFASAKIVVAPDGPSTDRYWSNRVYLTTSLGGLLLHPYCEELTKQYPPGVLQYYRDRDELEELIDYYLTHEEARKVHMLRAYEWTLSYHTYKDRCAELLRVVRERTR